MNENNDQKVREQKEKEMQAQMQLEAMLRKILSDEARQRLTNIKLAKPKLYAMALQSIIMLVREGHVQEKLSDEEVKSILQNLNAQTKKEINIRRK